MSVTCGVASKRMHIYIVKLFPGSGKVIVLVFEFFWHYKILKGNRSVLQLNTGVRKFAFPPLSPFRLLQSWGLMMRNLLQAGCPS